MSKRLRVAVLFGGTNSEHEVSLVSAQGILANLDRTKYDPLPILITKSNEWVTTPRLTPRYQPVIPDKLQSPILTTASVGKVLRESKVDVVFPVLHGPFGEDGTVQGLLELLRLPYVGCGVAASAVCMDKVLSKQLCQQAGIPIPRYSWFTGNMWAHHRALCLAQLEPLGYPLFVKPSSQGSSVGITKAHNQDELISGIKFALERDTKVLVEAAVSNAREIECSVLGNHDPLVSVLGEIIPANEFYDYKAKYLEEGSKLIIPAKLPSSLTRKIQETAKLAFTTTDCAGLSRVDFLLDRETNKFYLNELNTMPGFTPISMYPKLWEASGIAYPKLLDRLIELALERHSERCHLNYSI